MAELDETIRANGLPLHAMLSFPEINRHRSLVEQLAPSRLGRLEKRMLVEAIPFYVTSRRRDAQDTVLYCLVHKGRFLRSNIDQLEDRMCKDDSLAFLERSTPDFRALNRTILTSLETGRVGSLAAHRRFLTTLEERGLYLTEREIYYKILSGKRGYVRKLARRLEGIPFEGLEPHARAIAEALKEVLRFQSFRKPVPKEIVESLGFLVVPPGKLRRRRIFETVVIMTLADLLWSGRGSCRVLSAIGTGGRTCLPHLPRREGGHLKDGPKVSASTWIPPGMHSRSCRWTKRPFRTAVSMCPAKGNEPSRLSSRREMKMRWKCLRPSDCHASTS